MAAVNRIYKLRLTLTERQATIISVPYEQERLALKLLLDRVAPRWDSLRARLPAIPHRWLLLPPLVGLAVYAFFIRCMNLFNSGSYYLMSPDSYFFHWLAGRVMAGQGPPPDIILAHNYTLHSGLAYPLAYIAEAVGNVFGLSSGDALNLVCKFLPPLLAIASMLVIYLAASRISDRRVGLFSAFAWAAMMAPIIFGAAGYIDRDGLSILLIMTGTFLFYLSKGWHFHVRGKDMGWLLAGLGILTIEGLLFLEWSFVGSILLLAVISLYSVLRLLIGYFDRLQTEPRVVRRLTGALSDANYKVFGIIALGHLVFAAFNHHQVASWLSFAWKIPQYAGQGGGIAEMRGIAMWDIIGNYNFFLIPILIGLYFAFRRWSEGAILFSCWFLIMLGFSLFAKRVMLYTAPPACLLSGIALAYIWYQTKLGKFQALKKIGVAVLLCPMVLLSFSLYSMASSPTMAANEDWQEALAYIRDDTPTEAVIMTQWSWGYYILDLGQRRPVVDNGFYGWDIQRNHDIGKAYMATDPSEVALIMEKYDADYLIFSTDDRMFAPTIMSWVDKEQYRGFTEFPRDSLFERSIEGEFEYGGGLEVVYRSSHDFEVVILHLTQHA